MEVSGSRRAQDRPSPRQHGARLVVRRGQQSRRFWPLGLQRNDEPLEFKSRLAEAIQLLYDDAPIIGTPTCSISMT